MTGNEIALTLIALFASGGCYAIGYRHGMRWARRLIEAAKKGPGS